MECFPLLLLLLLFVYKLLNKCFAKTYVFSIYFKADQNFEGCVFHPRFYEFRNSEVWTLIYF